MHQLFLNIVISHGKMNRTKKKKKKKAHSLLVTKLSEGDS